MIPLSPSAHETPQKNAMPALANIQRTAWIMLVAGFAVELFYLLLAWQLGAWQMYALAGVILIFCVLNLIGLPLTYRRRERLGVWLIVVGMYIVFPAAVMLISDIAIIFGATVVILTFVVARQSLSPRDFRTAIVVSLFIGGFTASIDMWGLSYRLFVPEIQAFVPAITAVIVLVMAAFVVREAWAGNIRLKLITAFTIIALVSMTIVATVIYINYRNQLRDDIRQRLLSMVSIAALQQSAEQHAQIVRPEDASSDAYRAIIARNQAIVAADPDVVYLYTMRANSIGEIYYVVDVGRPGETNTAQIAETYIDASPFLRANFATMQQPMVEQNFYTDRFGTFLSAYAPFYNANGQREGIIGMDISADAILERERGVLFSAFGAIALASFLSIGIGWVLGNLFTTPILNLSVVAQQLRAGNLSARAQVDTADEVGDLAVSFNAMAAQLQQFIVDLEARVADRTKALRTLLEVSRRLSAVISPRELAEQVVEQLKAAFAYYHAHIYFFDENREHLVMTGGTGQVGATLLARGHKIERGRGLVGRAAESAQPILVEDVTREPDWLPNPLLPETRSELAVPILQGDTVLGVIDVQQDRVNALDENDISLLQAIAAQVAISLQNASAYERTRTQSERESLINTIGQRIQRADTVEETLQIALRELGVALNAPRLKVRLDPQQAQSPAQPEHFAQENQ